MKKDKCMMDYESKIREFADQMKEKKILDIGCGNGNYTSLFSKNGNEVVGVDINDFRQKQFLSMFKFVKYEGQKLPFDDEKFDIVISFDVIEHVEDDTNFVEEIFRVLKSGGTVYLATPNRTRLSNMLMKIMGRPVKYPLVLSNGGQLGECIHLREYISKELTSLLNKARFKNIIAESFWFGLRGGVNLGTPRAIVKSASQYLFMTAIKK